VTSTLADGVLAGDARAMARAISLIEDEDPAGAELVRAIFAHTGRAYLVGVTGPPGAGKSTLVDRIVSELRHGRRRPVPDTREGDTREGEVPGASGVGRGQGRPVLDTREGNGPSASGVGVGPHAVKVGVIAVDPTSPFSGGAVLGDRLRMQTHASDEGVFIRSMATRGHLGGLARATGDAALVLDAAGQDIVIIETVGVGQDEVDIIRTADVSVVTLVPGTGDEVQALKAGIMEIADIFVVNKADREGADRLVSSIEANLALQSYTSGEWRPPILQTVATTGRGVAELVDAIERFRAHSHGVQDARRKTRSEYRLREIVSQRFMAHLERHVLDEGEFASMVDRIAARTIDPYTAASNLIVKALNSEALESRRYEDPRRPR
jgi:LAO/AO transport system kinase